jgi:hypothetical protein
VDALLTDGIDEFKLDRPVGQKLQRPSGTAVWRARAGQGRDLSGGFTLELRWLARTGLVVNGFQALLAEAFDDIPDGGGANAQDFNNLSARKAFCVLISQE